MKIIKVISIAALVVFFASCCSCRSAKTRSSETLSSTEWQLVKLEGSDFTANDDSFTLTFDETEKRMYGRGDCNRINGAYNIPADGKISFSQTVSTRAFCADQATEDRYLSLLNSIDGYSIDGNTLMLYSNGSVKLVFKPRNI